MRIRLMGAVVLGALVCMLQSAEALADDASALLAKHQAYAGWQFGDDQTKMVEMTQTFTRSGNVEVTQRIRRIGGLYRVDSHDSKAGTDSSTGFTGNLFWYSDENGFTVPIIGDSAKSLLGEDLFFSDAASQLPWSIVRTETRWSKSYTVVRVEQPASFPLEIYVDPQSGAYGGVVIGPGSDRQTALQIIDYQSVGNRHFIGHWKFDGGRRTMALTDVKLGVSLSGQDLHPPQQSARWEFKSPKPFPIKLTARRIVMHARVNGVEGTFLLDSGAASIFLSGDFAHRAGLKASGHSEAHTLRGVERTDVGTADTLEAGGNILHNVKLYFGPPGLDSEAEDGLMGFGLLAATFATIDFENSTLQLQDPAIVDAASIAGVHIGVDLSDGTPTTLMYVQGKTTTVYATLDTGNPRFALISDQLVDSYGLHMTAAGVLGGCGVLDNMSIGPIVYDRPSACTYDFGGEHDALLGYDFLKGLAKLHFDYPHAAMILTPRGK